MTSVSVWVENWCPRASSSARSSTAGQIDDAQTGIAEGDIMAEVNAELVGSAVPDGPKHLAKGLFGGGRGGACFEHAGYAAHWILLFF